MSAKGKIASLEIELRVARNRFSELQVQLNAGKDLLDSAKAKEGEASRQLVISLEENRAYKRIVEGKDSEILTLRKIIVEQTRRALNL